MNYPRNKVPKDWKPCCICKQYPDEYVPSYRKWWHLWKSIFCESCWAERNTLNVPPSLGRKIRLTWLPKNNAWPYKNTYIGSEGEVKAVHEDGSFDLWMGTAWLTVGTKYRYEYIDTF